MPPPRSRLVRIHPHVDVEAGLDAWRALPRAVGLSPDRADVLAAEQMMLSATRVGGTLLGWPRFQLAGKDRPREIVGASIAWTLQHSWNSRLIAIDAGEPTAALDELRAWWALPHPSLSALAQPRAPASQVSAQPSILWRLLTRGWTTQPRERHRGR